MTDAALGRLPAIEVCGTDYPTSDGTAVRDYTHVKDLSDAHVLALGYLLRNGENLVLSPGTGHGHSLCELIAMEERLTECKVPLMLGPRREGVPPILVAQSTIANEVLG